MNEFKLLTKAKYLLRYFEENILINIPKVYTSYKIGIENNIIELNSNIIRANINEGNIRNKYQKEVLVSISMIDLYLSIILELNIINKKKFMVVSQILNEIRKMTISWIKSEKINLQ